ncbi:MAG: primosomal protein N' [Bdellovibrionaceae bacterium]|nr:primosomal protein N' [Pseudobdellovibrionaceae bacterium]|tara:strand:- start:1566 stop:3575 length:2010 start_codon:yes stop_codon:yes gene_type:complete
MDLKIVPVAIPRPVDGIFTYLIKEEWAETTEVGSWVQVPFGRSKTHAYVVEKPKNLSELDSHLKNTQLKEVIEVGDSASILPSNVWNLCIWAKNYYQAPFGEVLNAAASAAALGLRSKKKEPRPYKIETFERKKIDLNQEQQEAVQNISCHPGKVHLLHGVTGSGKTEVYIELIREVLNQGKSALILVPEIALTPQLHQRIERGLGQTVGLWHSAVSDGKRRDQWHALRNGSLKVVVGARSAVFAPIQNCGIIVVDEEHDSTFKQEERFRYQARDLAVVRGAQENATVVLGSATPSLETLERVREGKYLCSKLKERPIAGTFPTLEVVDLIESEPVPGTQAPFALKTLEAIRSTLLSGEQVIVFLNRRGFAAFLTCESCRQTLECPSCSISLSVHKRQNQVRCHVCGFRESIPSHCPSCHQTQWAWVGAGTESLEEQLPHWIPEMKPIRLDRDQITSTQRLKEVLEDFRSEKANTLLGTQMLVKGHDFPKVTLVVVVLADSLFCWPDFRASERAYQILTQVAGRAGRGTLPGRVMIQTYAPDHPVLQTLLGEKELDSFFEEEREMRQALGYPPFGRMARLRFESEKRETAMIRAQELMSQIQRSPFMQSGEALGPSEAFMERAKGIWRWDLLLKSQEISALLNVLSLSRQFCREKKWSVLVDVDPYGVG